MNFDRISTFYDRDIVPIWGRPFSQLLLREFPEQLSGSILEVGCATGFLAIDLIPQMVGHGRIIGLEPSSEMLEVARLRCEDAIRQKKLFLLQNDVRRLRFADDVFDLVYSNLGLYYMSDNDSLLPEVLRVLKPGRRGYFTLPLYGSFHNFFGPLENILRTYREQTALELLHQHLEQYPTPEEALYLMRSAGFDAVELSAHPFKIVFADGHSLVHSPFIRHNFLEEWSFYLHGLTYYQLQAALIEEFDLRRNHQQIELTIQAGCLIGQKEEYIVLG